MQESNDLTARIKEAFAQARQAAEKKSESKLPSMQQMQTAIRTLESRGFEKIASVLDENPYRSGILFVRYLPDGGVTRFTLNRYTIGSLPN
jgi:hypothetical protein